MQAEKVRDVSILAYTTPYRPKAPIKGKLTHAQLLHSVLSERLAKKEKDLRATIERLLEKMRARKSFLKKCVKCGEDIPIASEECQNCGTKQP